VRPGSRYDLYRRKHRKSTERSEKNVFQREKTRKNAKKYEKTRKNAKKYEIHEKLRNTQNDLKIPIFHFVYFRAFREFRVWIKILS